MQNFRLRTLAPLVQEVDERGHSAAPPERVFALLADARSWPVRKWVAALVMVAVATGAH